MDNNHVNDGQGCRYVQIRYGSNGHQKHRNQRRKFSCVRVKELGH